MIRLSEQRKSWATLALLWALLLLLAASRPMGVPDEGRYAEISRWMVQSGDWLVPRLDGIPFFHKPPLLHWINAPLLALLGVHVWVARLGPALHAALMLLALYWSARAALGELFARRAAIMLGSSLAFLVGGQYVNHDMLVACWIGLAIWAFAWSFVLASPNERIPHAGWARLGFVACALGVLSKGLIGLVLPGGVLFFWLIWTRQFNKIWRLPWLSGLLLFLLVGLPWFVLAERRAPGLLDYLFGDQQFKRYTASGFNNVRPWWFYFAGLLALMFPWAFFAAAQPLDWLRQSKALRAAERSPWTSLAWIWMAVILVFFSIPKSKLIGYALPVMPPLAWLAALGYERWLGASRWAKPVFNALLVSALAVAVALNIYAVSYTERSSTEDIAHTLACSMGPADEVLTVNDYPYDLPFLAQLPHALVAVQDWDRQRLSAGDTWQRELFEGAVFDPVAARTLQGQARLSAAAHEAGRWVVAPKGIAVPDFVPVQQGRAWSLYRSAATAVAGGGLPSCR